ncbi:hypothetical protein V8D89_010186 [Ganoderma adspersum]
MSTFSVVVASKICSIIGDLVVLFTTWLKTYTTYRAQGGVMKGTSLVKVMLYNGSVYFIVLTSMNTIAMILDQATLGLDLFNFATIVTDPGYGGNHLSIVRFGNPFVKLRHRLPR